MTDTGRSESERVGFCQNCGRPLSAVEVRPVGSAVYCEPCLAAKVAVADAAGASSGSSHGFGGPSSGVNYNFQGGVPPPVPPRTPGEPNPGLAALLGFIPGVGAFYNGQYAKGIVHLVVFAILTTLADRSGIFGLFVAGWIFYQVIEAHHTARARRDGTPLPNPFGLNDVGERLGFGRAWPGSAPGGAPVPPTAAASSQGETAGRAPEPPYTPPSSSYVPPAPGYGPQSAPGYAPPAPGYSAYAPPPQAAWGAPTESYSGVPPQVAPEMASVPLNGAGNSVPTGAIFLIGLGVLFLIGNSGFLRGFPIHRLVPFLLIGFGVWLFVRKMMETGGTLAAYRLRLFRAARGPVWIVLVGVLFFLDTFDILSWGRSWPLVIILGGLMTFFERTAYSGVVAPPYGYNTAPVPPAAAAPEPSAPASTVTAPTSPQERERG